MNQNNKLPAGLSVAALLAVSLLLAACSDSKEERANKPEAPQAASQAPAFNHPHGNEVSDLVKHKFEHDFAEQCVERETKTSGDDLQNRDRLEKSCMCIAQNLMKNLTAKEAELFLEEHKNTQSLRIRYEAAAYKCLQEHAQAQHQMPAIHKQQ